MDSKIDIEIVVEAFDLANEQAHDEWEAERFIGFLFYLRKGRRCFATQEQIDLVNAVLSAHGKSPLLAVDEDGYII